MQMASGLRRFVLTVHVTASVGWVGAVVAFLPLAVAGAVSREARTVRGAYLAMELIGWYALAPLALAALLTGLVQSLGTTWGLFRHYWVLFKLSITVVATAVLLTYLETLSSLARVAAGGDDLDVLRSPGAVLHAGIGLLLLLVATVLAVYKPQGTTRYGRRKYDELRARHSVTAGAVH